MKQSGFTLIEILAVLTVISILSITAIPNLLFSAIHKSIENGIGTANIARNDSLKQLLESNTCTVDSITGVGKYIKSIVREYHEDTNVCLVVLYTQDNAPDEIKSKYIRWSWRMDETTNKGWTCVSSLPDIYKPKQCT